MAFNPDLFRTAWGDVFSHVRGSCTWIEPFMLNDLASKINRIGRVRVISRGVVVGGERHDLSAYQIDIGETDTFFVTSASRIDLVGSFCHFYDGFTHGDVLRYFNGRVYFADYSNPVKRVTELGYTSPTVQGVVPNILIDMLRRLDVDLHEPSLLENVAGMAEWIASNFPLYSNTPWPTSG